MFNPGNPGCVYRDIICRLIYVPLTLQGNQYVGYTRPDINPWTPLYRISVDVPEAIAKNERAPREIGFLELLNAFKGINSGGLAVEIKRSGNILPWMYNWWAQPYTFLISDLTDILLEVDESYNIGNIVLQALSN